MSSSTDTTTPIDNTTPVVDNTTPAPVPEPAPIPVPTPVAEPIPSIITPSGLTITPVHSTNYDVINSQLSGYLSMNQKPQLTIFSDADATQYGKDDQGNDIKDFEVNSVSVTNSYIDSLTNLPVSSSITIMFNSGAKFKAMDGNDNYWFIVSGADFPIRMF
jgi:hypothetical protein